MFGHDSTRECTALCIIQFGTAYTGMPVKPRLAEVVTQPCALWLYISSLLHTRSCLRSQRATPTPVVHTINLATSIDHMLQCIPLLRCGSLAV